MKATTKSALLAAAFVGLSVGSARAQEMAVVRVPFPFTVRGEELPAGRYEVVNDQGLVMIRGEDNRGEAILTTIPADGRDPAGDAPALVFVRGENGYQLSQIWESSAEGFSLMKGSVSSKRRHADMQPSLPVVVTSGLDVTWK